MKITEVRTGADRRKFLELPVEIYKNDKEWIRPLDQDIEQVFNPEKNKAYRHGEAVRWLLWDDNGKCIGRIASFINRKTTARGDMPVGGIGFFECIDDQNAADFLFDHCVSWLREKGMQGVEGPINFGERDRWWGLLIDGFYEPVYCMNYLSLKGPINVLPKAVSIMLNISGKITWQSMHPILPKSIIKHGPSMAD